MNVIQGSPLPGDGQSDGRGAGEYGAGEYGAGSYGSGGYGPGGYGPGGYAPGGYGAGGYGTGGYGSSGYGPGGPGRRRRRGLTFGAAGVAAALAAGVGSYAALHSGPNQVGTATTSSSTVLSTSQIAGKVSPGLVDVNTTLGYQNAKAAGTGLVLTSTGEVLTNNHVINGATSISVTDVGNGRTYQATVVGYDASKDLAVLQLQNASGLRTVSLADSSTVKVGQKVVAIGNAEGKGGTPSVVTGNVLALNQSITASDEGSSNSEQLSGMIETDAPIQPGDSGGPLVDTAGQVVGIDTAASSASAVPSAQSQAYTPGQNQNQSQNGTGPQAQAFSIPINEAVSIANQIEAGSSSSTIHIGGTAFLGIEVGSSSSGTGSAGGFGGFGGDGSTGGFGGDGSTGGFGGSDTAGAAIEGVVSGSPAAQAGLAAGDVITSVAGTTVTSASQVQSALAGHHPGDKVSITWIDGSGQTQTATVTLATGPAL